MKILDLKGFSCPIPLMKVRDTIKDEQALQVTIDEPAAYENILKFAKSQGYAVTSEKTGTDYTITITKNA